MKQGFSSNTEAKWHSTALIHSDKLSYFQKQIGHGQTVYWEQAVAYVNSHIILPIV